MIPPEAAAAGVRLLDGVRVLDLSRVLAGPWAGQLLADYGADVIKVERPGSGDDTRAWGPPWWGDANDRMSAYYLCANRGKRSVAIDITEAEGQARVRELALEADVLIENYKVGQLAGYGLDATSLRTLNPRLVYCSITGYGQTGPDAERAGYDFAIQAEGGLMSITGEPGGEPQKVGVAVVDVMTGVYATTAILAALNGRHHSGVGCHIDMALLDVQMALLANQASNARVGQVAPRRLGNAHPNIVPYQVFATADGHVVVAVGNDAQFARLVAVLEMPQIASDVRFATNAARVANRTELLPLLVPALLRRTTAEWTALLNKETVPCAPILDIPAALQQPQVLARELLLDLHDEHGALMPLVGSPACFDGQRAVSRRPPPRLHQHGPALAHSRGWPGADSPASSEASFTDPDPKAQP